MKTINVTRLAVVSVFLLIMSGCVVKPVVAPGAHQHQKHVVHHVRPAKRHCWRHKRHWDCK